jgi:formin 2
LSDVGPPILVLQKACKEVGESKALKEFLIIVLSVGNYINGGNATRGQADGFNLETIDKLTDTKDSTNKGTLLDLAMKYVSNWSLPDELPHVAEAATVDFKTIQGNFNRLAKELEEIKVNCQEVLSAAEVSADDQFRRVLPEFVADAEKKLLNMRNQVVHTEAIFLDTVDYFTVSRDRTIQQTADSFFGTWRNLVANFKKAMPKQARPAARRDPAQPYGARLGEGEDPMADLIANIRAGKKPPRPTPLPK